MTKGRRKTMDSKQVTGQDVSADVKKTSSTSKRKQSATHLELQQHQATATHMNSPTKPPPQKKSRPPTQPSHAKQPLIPSFENMDWKTLASQTSRQQPVTALAKQRRRSSFSLRGKRKSSMGGEVQVALHQDITTDNFYKHVSLDLPDPVRLRQVLIYAMERTMSLSSLEGETANAQVDEAVKAVLQDVFQDLVTKKINTSWYHRPRDEMPVVVKPNPCNEQNARFILGYNQEIERLEKEKNEWQIMVNQLSLSNEALCEEENKRKSNVKHSSEHILSAFSKKEAELMAVEHGGHKPMLSADQSLLQSKISGLDRQFETTLKILQKTQRLVQMQEKKLDKQFVKLVDACWPLDEERLVDEEAVEATKLRLTAMRKAFYANWNHDKTQDYLRVLATALVQPQQLSE